MIGRLLAAAALVVAGTVPALAALHLEGRLEQGALIRGTTDPGSRVTVDGRAVRVDGQGRFAFGLGRDAGPGMTVTTRPPGGPAETTSFAVARRAWPVQRIDGLPPAQVTPDPPTLARIKRENDRLVALRRTDGPGDAWAGTFIWPADGRISGVFGSQRILNGTPRSPHSGVDVAIPTGTPVKASAGGVVALAEADLFFTGGTIVIDHGAGVMSIYAHLSRLDVQAGQAVTQGAVIGASGATGRATGPHLHFGLTWFEVKLDPESVLPPRSH